MIKVAMGLVLGGLVTTVADQPPKYNIDGLCKAVTKVLDGTGEKFAGCVKDETAARDNVAAVWALAKPSTRQTCAGEEGAQKSYVDLVTCMQLYEGNLPWKK
jgi:hypothetical protein